MNTEGARYAAVSGVCVGHMENKQRLSGDLENKLRSICHSQKTVQLIMGCLDNEAEYKTLIDVIESGGTEATPKNLAYLAIGMANERDGHYDYYD